MSRVLQDIPVMFQRFALDTGVSVRHVCDMANDPNAKSNPNRRSYEEANWAKLSSLFRAAHNRLRRARGEPSIPEPKVDLYVPPQATSAPLPFNPADPEAIAAECEFRGLGDQTPDWKEIAKQLALKLACDQLADRRLHTEVLHRVIAQFVVLATKESGRNRKWIIDEAVRIYGVSARTVETAIADYPEKLFFTKLGPPS
jgi:hypothetical protein